MLWGKEIWSVAVRRPLLEVHMATRNEWCETRLLEVYISLLCRCSGRERGSCLSHSVVFRGYRKRNLEHHNYHSTVQNQPTRHAKSTRKPRTYIQYIADLTVQMMSTTALFLWQKAVNHRNRPSLFLSSLHRTGTRNLNTEKQPPFYIPTTYLHGHEIHK